MPPLSTLIIGSVNTVIRLFGSNAIIYLSDSLITALGLTVNSNCKGTSKNLICISFHCIKLWDIVTRLLPLVQHTHSRTQPYLHPHPRLDWPNPGGDFAHSRPASSLAT